ncbi:MAG: C25 family cysteine peptidase, partial [Saccharofermentanaceae bacterium]
NAPQNIVPKRGLYADPGSGYADDDIPSDMYYACLDGTWNTNNNNKWGEPGEDDLYYEVGIGRLCVDNSTELGNMLNKLTLYQTSPVTADIQKGLMIGEQLDGSTYGDDYKEEIVTGGSMNGYVTEGMPLTFSITRLYESQGNWEKTNVFSNFNNGAHLLNHLGHSNVDYNMKMYNSDITTSNFQNNGVNHGFVIGYSQGCYNGSFDNRGTGSTYSEEDCFAETITTLATAEVAGVSNARYGWYNPGGTNGGSQFFDRQFFDALFGENIYLIGDMNSDSKEDNVSYINGDGVVRWCGYETNLFGDPTMDIWTAVPTGFQATYPVTISVGMDQMEFQTGTPYARIALMQDGSLIGRGIADANGDATILFEPIVTVAPISVSIIGHNRIRHQGSVIVISDQPYVVYQSYQINDPLGNNNQLLDPEETVGLTMALKNFGNQPASNAVATLSTTDPDISITDNTENFGNIAAGETVSVDNAFGLTVSNSIPDQHLITFNVAVAADSVWNSQFTITANAPVFSIGSISVNDIEGGNGNGRLDAGETVDVSIMTSNLGHSNAAAVLAAITSASPYITINSGTYTIGAIGVNETATATFNLTVALGAPVGASADINYTVTSGGYSAQKTFIAKVGLTLEDFESGNFNHFDWAHSGSQPWTVNSVDPYEGIYSAQSGDIINNQKSQLMLTMDVPGSDSISFYLKTSCENIFDRLRFYIDATQMGQWYGETGWTRVAYPVTAGNHTFKWEYKKDGSNSAGSDCAWLDYIIFPAIGNTGLSVTGAVTYANTSNTPLSNLSINLKNGAGTIIGTATTNASGAYSFSPVPAGSYTFDVTCAKPWDGVTAMDVLLFRKHIASIELLTGIYLSSGDVNASGDVTASDVLLLKKRIAYINNSFPTGDWLFNNTSFVMGSSNLVQDFKGIAFGDANGSYVPPAKMIPTPAPLMGALSIGTVNAVPGEVTIPVYISDIQNLGAFQFTIQYDAAKLQFENIANIYPGMEDITVGNPVPGYITFVWVAETNGISIGNGILFNLKFSLLSSEGSAI